MTPGADSLTQGGTLRRMKTRYRDAYNARHSSVSWNLMVGKNPLWVAKMHGHSVQTMLDTYAAWTEGAQESDVEAIRVAMAGAPERSVQSLPAVVNSEAILVPPAGPRSPLEAPEFGSRMAVEHPPSRASACSTKRSNGGERVRQVYVRLDTERSVKWLQTNTLSISVF